MVNVAKRGDIGAMGDLADRLGELAQVPSRAAAAACDGINLALEQQFADGVDPYGAAWAPLAERTLLKHGEPALTETGDMRDGTMAKPSRGAGIELTVPFPGAIHQTGAKRGAWVMPARKILPEGGALPDAWKEAIDEAMADAFGKAMGK
jgi:hypothetical protein